MKRGMAGCPQFSNDRGLQISTPFVSFIPPAPTLDCIARRESSIVEQALLHYFGLEGGGEG